MPWFRLLFRFNLSTWLEIGLRKVAVGGFALKRAAITDSRWNLSFWLAWRHSLIFVHSFINVSQAINQKPKTLFEQLERYLNEFSNEIQYYEPEPVISAMQRQYSAYNMFVPSHNWQSDLIQSLVCLLSWISWCCFYKESNIFSKIFQTKTALIIIFSNSYLLV